MITITIIKALIKERKNTNNNKKILTIIIIIIRKIKIIETQQFKRFIMKHNS